MAARWTIADQYPETFYPRNAAPTPGRRFIIREETTGSEDEFWLPDRSCTPENVSAEAQSRADKILAFSQLGQ